MPRTFSTVRELIYWEYAKLISEKAVGDRMNYKFINFTGAIQSKPAALFGASSNSPALFKENRYMSALTPWDPFRELEELQNRLATMLGGTSQTETD